MIYATMKLPVSYAIIPPKYRLDLSIRLGCFIANAFSKALRCRSCTGLVIAGGGFRRISKADSSRPTENGGGASREQCDGINSAAR